VPVHTCPLFQGGEEEAHYIRHVDAVHKSRHSTGTY